jgi:hypothetical protein
MHASDAAKKRKNIKKEIFWSTINPSARGPYRPCGPPEGFFN